MLTSVTLQNFKSFGREQTVPLEPITALVGPNNSGKSCFMTFARFVQNGVSQKQDAVQAEGGLSFLFHRPKASDGTLKIGWNSTGEYSASYRPQNNGMTLVDEKLLYGDADPKNQAWTIEEKTLRVGGETITGIIHPFLPTRTYRNAHPDDPTLEPVLGARLVKLDLKALRSDSTVSQGAVLDPDGRGLAAVLGVWKGSQRELSDQLDGFLSRCVPEIKEALVKPAPKSGEQRLWFRQTDGEQFDAEHASDGLLAFTALAMNVIEIPKGAVLFVEEPEASIHPSRLVNLVELMRTAVQERGCQFVLATHSPVLLNELSSDPSRIVLFRRGPEGTEVKRCTELPAVQEQLHRLAPGDLLATAFFEAAWPREA